MNTKLTILCYNAIRWAGSFILPSALCLLMAMPTVSPLLGETITIPTQSLYNSWDVATQRAFNWKLGGVDVGNMIAVGELVPGQRVNLSLPPINMTVQMYRWSEMWANAQRQSAVDYQELLQWRRFYDSVERCDGWLERQRKLGLVPIYPSVVDVGVPFFDTYTQEILVPDPTFVITRPWLWGVE